MPRGNGTGPMGMGRMTGRRAGYCAGFAGPGCADPARFAGSRGCGFGHGHRRMFYATGMPGWARSGFSAPLGADEAGFGEKALLTNEAEVLESRLQQVKQRLSSLNGKSE